MYKQHFGFREVPFGITPDTGFFFASTHAQEALNTLLIAVRNGEGFIKITGEVGTGKTLLCRKFMAALGEGFVTAYIPNPYLEPRTLMFALADELELDLPRESDQHQLLKAINHRLLVLAREGRKVVLCLDEAQSMPLETLEAIRLLTNLETEKRKLLQIVMFGQPELDQKLAADSIRQLRQRITFHYELKPLAGDELDNYLLHRLRAAGYAGDSLFSGKAVRVLRSACKGVPRMVNIIAHKALMAAYGEGVHGVDKRHVKAAVKDTDETPSYRWKWLAGMAGVLMAAIGGGWVYFR